jgi:hypothetical protein
MIAVIVLMLLFAMIAFYMLTQNPDKPVTNQDCVGYYDPAQTCPTTCGYNGGSVTQNYITTTPASGTGSQCPPSSRALTCNATPACVRDQDCVGYYDPAQTCSTTCGYPGGVVLQDYKTLVQASGSGEQCPGSRIVYCNATSACPSTPTQTPTQTPTPTQTTTKKVVKHCVWGSNNPLGGDPICPQPNEYPGWGTCYKKPLDASLYKIIDKNNTDPDTSTRCYNESALQKGTSLAGSVGAHTYIQAQNACTALGPGWRLPRTVDEAGETCGTGHGLDGHYMWTELS